MAKRQNFTALKDGFQNILICKWCTVRKDIQVEHILYKLKSKSVISDEEEQQISSGDTSFKKADHLRDVLLKKDRCAFNVFCDALEEKYPHLTRILRNIPHDESEGPMTKLHRDLLTKHTAMLVDNIFVVDILGYLQAKFVFGDDDRQVICAEKSDSLQVQKLLNLLPSRGDAAFQHFVDSLESVHPYLVDCFHEDQVDSSSLSLERGATHTDSREYINWVILGKINYLVRKPLVSYVTNIIQTCHTQLLQNEYSQIGACTRPEHCLQQKKAQDLCEACSGWYYKLASYHCNESQANWRQNCDTSKWPVDAWEVAKFFMPVLGDGKSTVKDANSTDLPSLLHVLEKTKDEVFGEGTQRIDKPLIQKLRQEVRNIFAHAPNHEISEDKLQSCVQVACDFLDGLKRVFPDQCVEASRQQILSLADHGVTNVIETKLWRELSIGVNDLSLHPKKRIDQDDQQLKPKSNIPEKLSSFVGRNDIMKQAVDTFLAEGESRRIVSLIAPPGFGKSVTAIEIAHRVLNSRIPVVFVNLKSASTVEEVILRLCYALLVAPQDSPLSSLCLFLQNVAPKCSLLVMDNVEQILEEETRDEFLRLLSETLQKFHILLTSSKVISEVHLPNQTVIHFKELGRDSSVELVRKCCPRDIKDDFVNSLAQLCGDMPLALRIAASRLLDSLTDPKELLKYLRDEPLKVLTTSSGGTPEVEKCIQMSFDRLTDEQQILFVRLSVFNGTFSKNEAINVIGLKNIELRNFLSELVKRSLLEQGHKNARYQFFVHTLINSFLTNCCGNSSFPTERRLAKEKMVMCFLKVSHDLTLRYWSKDGCNEGRRLLQAKGPNIEAIWKICEESVNNALGHHDDTPADDTHRDPPTNEDTVAAKKIIEVLTKSTIYQWLTRLHYHFILHVLPHSTVASFLNVIATVARQRGDTAHEILVQCLKAHFYGRQFGRKSEEHLNCIQRAEEIFHEKESKLQEANEMLRLEAYSYYCYSKHLSSEPSNELYAAAEDSLQQYLELKGKKHAELVNTGTNVKDNLEKVDMAVTYMMLGRTYSFKQHSYFNMVRYYNRALRIFKTFLGDHDMKLCCYKEVGDLFFRQGNHEKAVAFYESARKVHRQLGATNSNISSVYLLKNFGLSLANISREEDALELLKEAYDVVMKLFKDNQACKTEVHCALAETYDKLNRPEAVKHAREALCCNTRSKRGEIVAEKMNKIIAKANGSVQMESLFR